MSGYYAANPHYAPADYSEDREARERAEKVAGDWFAYATRPQHQLFADRMANARAFKGAPKWERVRRAAQREFERTITEAAALCNETIEHYMAHGEVLEELADRWEALAAKTNAAGKAFASLEAAE